MRGPFWNNPKIGVTGEPKAPANYVTYTDEDGQPVTLVGEAADRYRESLVNA